MVTMDSVDCPLNIVCNIQRGESLQKRTLRNKHVENEEKLMIQDDITKMWNNGKRTFKISIQRRMWKKPINASNLTFKIYSRMLILLAVISGRAVYATQRDSSFKIMDENSSNTIVGHGIVTKINSNVTQKNNSNRFTGTLNLLDDNTVLASATVRATNLNITSSNSSSLTTTTSTGNIDGRNFKAPITAVHRNTIEVSEENKSGPYFDKSASKNITALLGKTAYLNCRVKNFGNKTMLLQVSWVRHRDIHLLTVGRYTYTSDQRFRAIHQPQTEDWILQIKYPQHRDSGIYECQVSTTPHMSHYIHLNVVEPSTEIIGAPDLYIESGSTINLTCVILNSPEPPAYIFWNHNSAIINYDSPRGGVSVVTNKGETTTSFLLIKAARPTDSGQYQCNPSNSKSKGVTVHVLNGEFPAAMQRAGQAHHQMSPNHYLLVCISTFLSAITYIKVYQRIPNSVGHI